MLTPKTASLETLDHGAMGGLHCGSCRRVFDVEPEALARAYIDGVVVDCPACGASYDLWDQLVEKLTFGVFGYRYAAIGAQVVYGTLRLTRNQPLVLNFTKLGLPSAGTVEEVHVTPMSGGPGFLAPVFHADLRPGQPAANQLLIYPMPVNGGSAQNLASILIVWLPERREPDPIQDALLAAVRAVERRDQAAALLAANVAMELALGRTMSTWLETYGVGRERRSRFLSSDATYGAQLSVLLPVVARMVDVPPLPEHVAAGLARLRKLRNAIAHGGPAGGTVADRDVPVSLAAAAIGVTYCQALSERLETAPS